MMKDIGCAVSVLYVEARSGCSAALFSSSSLFIRRVGMDGDTVPPVTVATFPSVAQNATPRPLALTGIEPDEHQMGDFALPNPSTKGGACPLDPSRFQRGKGVFLLLLTP
jgi:hypothetical protein